jgi:hypothetical protein
VTVGFDEPHSLTLRSSYAQDTGLPPPGKWSAGWRRRIETSHFYCSDRAGLKVVMIASSEKVVHKRRMPFVFDFLERGTSEQ